jgi:metal-responsive CopG/Arc/MetJ family transcriptional regulator
MSVTKAPPTNRRKRVPATSARPGKRVVVDFPQPLYRETERSAAELETNRSEFIRLAVETFIADMRRKRLQRQLEEGYTAMAALSQQVADDFRHVDSEWP